eukprot:6382961-Ditylum_brightwellii.AAC.1
MTVKEWVAEVLELNKYLKDFPAHNGMKHSHLTKTKSWTSWNMEYHADKPKDKKSPKPKNAGKHKADVPTKPAGEKKFYCNLATRLTTLRTAMNSSNVRNAQSKPKSTKIET